MGLSPKIPPGGSAIGQQAFVAQGGAGRNLSGMGSNLAGIGMPALAQSGRYFSTLAGGNRGAMTQALSPEISNISDVYTGAGRSLSRFLRGPEKDVQMGELERNRAGQIGSLLAGGRGAANQSLANFGVAATGAAGSAYSGAGSIFGSQAKTAQDARIAEVQAQEQAGQGFGGLFFNLLKLALPGGGIWGGKKGG